jgi:hypothetical protein
MLIISEISMAAIIALNRNPAISTTVVLSISG